MQLKRYSSFLPVLNLFFSSYFQYLQHLSAICLFSSSQLSSAQESQGKSKLKLLLLLKIRLRYYYRFILLLLEITKNRKRTKEKVSKERGGNASQIEGCTKIKGSFGEKELKSPTCTVSLPVFCSKL